MMKDNSKVVFNYLKSVADKNVTAADVEAATGIAKASVNGIFTAFQKKGWGYREEAEIELADGKHQAVKFLRLTEDGMSVDPDAE